MTMLSIARHDSGKCENPEMAAQTDVTPCQNTPSIRTWLRITAIKSLDKLDPDPEREVLTEEGPESGEITFYDSNTGKPLFYAPKERTWEAFVRESQSHGWPSFRDSEVNWEYVRCLPDGECVSVDGTHLGHNLPDGSGNRYCINLVSVAGYPTDGA